MSGSDDRRDGPRRGAGAGRGGQGGRGNFDRRGGGQGGGPRRHDNRDRDFRRDDRRDNRGGNFRRDDRRDDRGYRGDRDDRGGGRYNNGRGRDDRGGFRRDDRDFRRDDRRRDDRGDFRRDNRDRDFRRDDRGGNFRRDDRRDDRGGNFRRDDRGGNFRRDDRRDNRDRDFRRDDRRGGDNRRDDRGDFRRNDRDDRRRDDRPQRDRFDRDDRRRDDRRDDRRGGGERDFRRDNRRDDRRDHRGQGNRDDRRGGKRNFDRDDRAPKDAPRKDEADAKPVEPELPEGLDPSELDPEIRRELQALPKGSADTVARHLVASGQLIDSEPEKALEHARFARQKAARIASAREANGLAAYLAGEWNEALSELRAARRIGGGPGHLAIMADCERALGRPERAVELVRSDEALQLDKDDEIELRIVAAGARRDLGEIDASVVSLQVPELDPKRQEPWSARLFYAYADNLAAAGRDRDAFTWFVHAAHADDEEETDAPERLEELAVKLGGPEVVEELVTEAEAAAGIEDDEDGDLDDEDTEDADLDEDDDLDEDGTEVDGAEAEVGDKPDGGAQAE